MPTPFGVIAFLSGARKLPLLFALPVVVLVASPALAKAQAVPAKQPPVKSKAAQDETLPTLWIGPKPATAAGDKSPATSSAPVRAEAPAAPAPALLTAPQPSPASAPAKSVETKAPRAATIAAKVPAAESLAAAKSPVILPAKPLIFNSALTAEVAPRSRDTMKSAVVRSSKARPTAVAKTAPVLSEPAATVSPRVPAPAPVATARREPGAAARVAIPAPAPAAASAKPQDLDDMPLSSVLSKNTAGEGKSQRSTGGMVADVLTKLGFVILLGIGAAAGWRKFQGQSFARPAKPQATAEVSSVVALGPQRSVHLLRIGNQTLVVASTPQNVSLLATIDDSQAADAGFLTGEVNETDADFQALLGQLVQGGVAPPQERVQPVKSQAVEETGGRAFAGLKGSLFSAAAPVSGSRADA